MKLLPRLSVAALMVVSSFAGRSLKDFTADPQIQAAAPHLIQLISSRPIEYALSRSGSPNPPTGNHVPLFNDIVEIVSQTVFTPKSKEADWSRLEAAKLKAIQAHGEEAVYSFADLTAIDTHRALLIVNTIYDTVVHLPPSSKVAYAASTTKKSFSFWDFIGFGLIKSSDAVRGVKSFVSPQSGGCNTQDTVYLRSVKEIVYYSSLTDGVAGGAMAAAPSNSAVKSLGLGTIIASVGKLAVEIHMAQSIAQLAGLDPFDESVRAMVYLALAADSPSSDYALTARDIFKVKSRGIASKVSMEALRFLERETALVLITKGTGRIIGQGAFPSMPVVRNIFAFSRDVLNMNSVGDVLKYVFCPGQNSEPLSVEDDNLESPSDHDRNGAAEDVSINENHDGAVEDEEADEHDKNESYVEQTAGDNRPLGGGQKAFNTPQGVNQVEQQKAAGEQKRQDL